MVNWCEVRAARLVWMRRPESPGTLRTLQKQHGRVVQSLLTGIDSLVNWLGHGHHDDDGDHASGELREHRIHPAHRLRIRGWEGSREGRRSLLLLREWLRR